MDDSKVTFNMHACKINQLSLNGYNICNYDEFLGLTDEEVNEVESSMTEVDLAWNLAKLAHKGQLYGDMQYTYHLEKVVELVKSYGKVFEIVAILHDAIEDTDLHIKVIQRVLGNIVAENVLMVTDPEGCNRKERKRLLNERFREADGLNRYLPAFIVKVADRLANVRESTLSSSFSKFRMYKKEYPEFREAFYRQGMCDEMWKELDDLCQWELRQIPVD